MQHRRIPLYKQPGDDKQSNGGVTGIGISCGFDGVNIFFIAWAYCWILSWVVSWRGIMILVEVVVMVRYETVARLVGR